MTHNCHVVFVALHYLVSSSSLCLLRCVLRLFAYSLVLGCVFVDFAVAVVVFVVVVVVVVIVVVVVVVVVVAAVNV